MVSLRIGKTVAVAAIATMALTSGAAVSADVCGAAKIVFSGYSGTTELVDFPALVRISAEKMPEIDFTKFQPDGSDLRFFDADGNEIPREIERWDPAGESLVWVRVPRLSGNDTFVTMRWGATVTPVTKAKDVWTAYTGVWHMNETATEMQSATGTGFALSGTDAPTAVDGAVGAGVKLVKAMSAPNFLKTPWSVPSDSYAVSAWYYNPVSATPTYYDPIYFGAYGENGWFLEYKSTRTGAVLYRNSSSTALNFSADYSSGWIHMTLVFDHGKLTAYQNGVRTLDAVNASVTHNMNHNFRLTDGQMDEVRILPACPSHDWAVADYATQKNSDFAVATEVTNPTRTLLKNAWTVEPSLVHETVRSGQAPQIEGASRYGVLSLTYDETRTTTVPTDVGWHTVHVGVEPTDEAYGLDAVDFRFFVRHAWSEDNVGEAFIEIPANPKGITLTDYPVMLRLSASTLAGVDMTTMADGGADLRFYDTAGNELAHDVESFDRNGDSFIWVKVPTFGPEKQVIVMNWGGTKTRTTADADVWAGYGAVWHMTTSPTIPDATGNGLELTGSVAGSLATQQSPRGAGVKLGAEMSASDFYAAGVPRDNHTVSFWYYYPDYSSGEGYIMSKGSWASEGYYLFQTSANQLRLIDNMNAGRQGFSTEVNAKTTWSFVTIVHTSNHTEIFVNGVSRYSENTPDTKTTTYDFTLNARQFDEIRVRKSAASADEIAVDYQNQKGLLCGTMSLVQNATSERTLVPVPAVPAEVVYNGAEQRPVIPESDDYTVGYGEGDYTSVGDYEITLTLKDPVNTAWAGNTTAPKVLAYRILKSDNDWTAYPSLDKAIWTAGEAAATVSGASQVGQMSVRYDEARVEEMPLTPGFHVAYCSVTETADHAGLSEVALCYRVLSAAETGSCRGDMTIRLSGYAGKTTLTNFPVLVRLSAAKVAELDMTSFNATSPKLWFYDEEGTRLKYDVERWDPAGESLVWVLVPRVKSNTTRLSMQWSTGRGTRSSATDVWSDFAAVWHMNEEGTTRTDVSGHGLDLVSDLVCTQLVGKVGMGTAGVGALSAPDFFDAPYSVPKTDFAMSFWYRMPTHGSTEQALWNKGSYEDGGLYYVHQANSHFSPVLVTSKNLCYGKNDSDCRTEWTYATVAFSNGKLRFSTNGQEPAVQDRDTERLGAFPFVLNASHHFDEFRIRKAAPSDDWIRADYATQSSDSFCTFSVIRNAKQSGLFFMIQ